MTRKRIAERTERIAMNAVSGKLEVTVLDAVTRAEEMIHRAIDREMTKLAAPAQRYELVRRLQFLLEGMLPHTGGDGS